MASRFESSDECLADAIASGDREAVTYFFNRFKRLIYANIHRDRRVERHDIDDIFNGFFIYLAEDDFRRIRAWRREGGLATYIFAVSRNYIRDYYRKSETRTAASEALDENWPDETYNAEDHFDAARLRELLISAKKTLGERDRRICCLRIFRDLDAVECAKQLDLTVNAFNVAYSRAKERLTKAFQEQVPTLFPEGPVR